MKAEPFAPPNPARAPRFHLGCRRRRVGEQGRSANMNANGVPQQSPGLERSDYPGIAGKMLSSTPTGLRTWVGLKVGGTPMGFDGIGNSLPRVGVSRQPWALLRNAVGVRRYCCTIWMMGAEPFAPPNPAMTPRFHVGRRERRVGEHDRSL